MLPKMELPYLVVVGNRGYFGRGDFLISPGTYSVQLYKTANGQMTPLSEPENFEVKELREGALPRASHRRGCGISQAG